MTHRQAHHLITRCGTQRMVATGMTASYEQQRNKSTFTIHKNANCYGVDDVTHPSGEGSMLFITQSMAFFVL